MTSNDGFLADLVPADQFEVAMRDYNRSQVDEFITQASRQVNGDLSSIRHVRGDEEAARIWNRRADHDTAAIFFGDQPDSLAAGHSRGWAGRRSASGPAARPAADLLAGAPQARSPG
jgi:hypothetical protein